MNFQEQDTCFIYNFLNSLKNNIRISWQNDNPLKILYKNQNLEPIANYIFFGNGDDEFPKFWNLVAETVNNMSENNRSDLFLLLRVQILTVLIQSISKTLKIMINIF